MLRIDGEYVFYKIFYRASDGNEYPTYGAPENSRNNIIIKNLFNESSTGKALGTCQEEYREFTASGECWQTIGEHGTFNKPSAIKLMTQLALDNPSIKFSVKRTTISQLTETVASMSVD
jgi:hypothetical protein